MITIMMVMMIIIMMMMMMATPIHLHDLDMMTIDISSIEYFNCCQKLQFIYQFSSIQIFMLFNVNFYIAPIQEYRVHL